MVAVLSPYGLVPTFTVTNFSFNRACKGLSEDIKNANTVYIF